MLKRLLVVGLITLSTSPLAGEEASHDRGWIPADPTVECATVEQKALCTELLALRDKDQVIRHRLIESPNDPSLLAELEKVDAANLARITEILERLGWPRKADVGQRAAAAPWLIIQHADLDTQERYIDLMKSAAAAGELEQSLIALTIDRIRVGQGRPQLYGTQFRELDGELVPEPIEDPGRLDERRAEVGLGPFAEYQALIRQSYGKKPPAGDEQPPDERQ